MSDALRRQTIESWVSDFTETPSYDRLPPAAKAHAQDILPAFLESACAARDVMPDDLGQDDVKSGLLQGVAALGLPATTRAVAPDACAALLAELEDQGRLADGRALARYTRALREAFEQRTTESPRPIRNPGPRIGRNEPCPCGSGRKYKACCLRKG